MTQRKSRNFWTKDNVIASARQYANITEWRKQGHGAYAKAREMGWLEEATYHMKKNHDWTHESVKKEASKYSTLSEWSKKGGGSYSKAQKEGWLEELSSLFKRQIRPNGYWTKQRVLDDAKQFKSRSDWRKKSSSASTMATRNGWFEEATSHMKMLVEHGKWTKDNVLQSAKKFAHIVDWQKTYPAAYNKALRAGWLTDATKHMAPKPKELKWTKELVIADAKKYESRGEWFKGEGNAAHVAIKNGWYEQATAHMHRVYSVGEMTLFKALTQLNIKFETQKRFRDIKDKRPLPFDFYLPEFNLVIEYQGLQHFEELNRKGRESLKEIQKRDAIKHHGALVKNISYIAISAVQETEIERQLTEKLKELSVDSKIPLNLFKRDLTNEETVLLKSLGTWSKEQILADARKYDSYPEWRKNSPAHQVAIKNGWLEECKKHMISEHEVRSLAKTKWTKEKIQSLVSQFNSRSAFKKSNPGAYNRARLNGWSEELFAHMKRKVHPNGYWTKERVFESAQKFKTRNEWQSSEDRTAYSVARENGWLEAACAHMEVSTYWIKRLKKK